MRLLGLCYTQQLNVVQIYYAANFTNQHEYTQKIIHKVLYIAMQQYIAIIACIAQCCTLHHYSYSWDACVLHSDKQLFAYNFFECNQRKWYPVKCDQSICNVYNDITNRNPTIHKLLPVYSGGLVILVDSMTFGPCRSRSWTLFAYIQTRLDDDFLNECFDVLSWNQQRWNHETNYQKITYTRSKRKKL